MFKLRLIKKPILFKLKCDFSFPPIVLANLQEKEVTPTRNVQEIVAGPQYDGLSKVIVDKIPDDYIIPNGELEINANGIYDVKEKENVNVNVPTLDVSDYFADNLSSIPQTTFVYYNFYIKKVPYFTAPDGVTSLNQLFSNYRNLQEVDLSGLASKKGIINIGYMFSYCLNIKKIDLSLLDLSEVTTITFAFNNCISLEEINLSSLSGNVTNITSLFNSCRALKNIDISNFDFTKVTTYSNAFTYVPNDCYILVKNSTNKQWFKTNFSRFTNVHYVGE